MPRYYAKHKLSIDFSVLLEASKQIKIHGNSIRSVAKSLNIPHATLTRHVKKIDEANIDVSTATSDLLIDFFKTNSTPGANPVFNAQQEKALIQYILKATSIHYGLSIAELKSLAYQYAKKIGISYPASWNDNSRASNDWYYAFMNRHPNLSLRTPEQGSQNRANQRSASGDSDTEKQRRTVVLAADIETAAHAEMITHEVASTSGTISSAFLRETLRKVGPLKRGTPAKKSNRGRKPMKTTILTSPEAVSELKKKANTKRKKLEKSSRGEAGKAPVPKKRKYRAEATTKRNVSSSEDEDVDFCILCMEDMPKKLSRNNSIRCDLCDRAVHLKCVSTGAYFTCPNCESE